MEIMPLRTRAMPLRTLGMLPPTREINSNNNKVSQCQEIMQGGTNRVSLLIMEQRVAGAAVVADAHRDAAAGSIVTQRNAVTVDHTAAAAAVAVNLLL